MGQITAISSCAKFTDKCSIFMSKIAILRVISFFCNFTGKWVPYFLHPSYVILSHVFCYSSSLPVTKYLTAVIIRLPMSTWIEGQDSACVQDSRCLLSLQLNTRTLEFFSRETAEMVNSN